MVQVHRQIGKPASEAIQGGIRFFSHWHLDANGAHAKRFQIHYFDNLKAHLRRGAQKVFTRIQDNYLTFDKIFFHTPENIF